MHHKIYTGIVLKRQPHREADEVITLWSWEEGKVRLLARGVRRSSSKLKRAVVPLNWLQLQAAPSRRLPVIYGVKVIRNYGFSTLHMERAAAIFSLFEMILKTTADSQPNLELSLLLREALEYLQQAEKITVDFFIAFRLRMLQALGLGLQWQRCARCQKPIPQAADLAISFIAGGLICQSCRRFSPDWQKIDADVVKFLQALKPQTIRFSNLAGRPEVKHKTDSILNDFFYALTERELKSKKFLESFIM